MGLRVKFNLVLLLVFLLGFGATGYVSHDLLHRNAREEVLRSAGMMMEAALSMRGYTLAKIRPLLPDDADDILPESASAFAATDLIIGAQIVSVPMGVPMRNANRAVVTFMTSLSMGSLQKAISLIEKGEMRA
jgi:hypothetical protein